MVKASEASAEVGRAAPQAGRGPRVLRWLAVAVVVILLAGGTYVAYTQVIAAPPPAVAPQLVKVQRGTITSTVSSTGTVAALTTARLAFRGSGRVAEVAVKQGDAVKKEQLLAKLDTTDLALQVSQVRAQLSTAQAKLASVKAGSRSEDVRAAQAQLDAARSRLEVMLAGSRLEDVEAAKAAVTSARARLTQLRNTPLEADAKAAEQSVAAARSALQRAQSDLAKLKAGPTELELRGAQLAVEQAKDSLWSQQLNRDGVCGNPKNSAFQCDSANAGVAAATVAVTIAQNNLAKLQAAARAEDLAATEQAVASAEAQLASAQTKLKQVKAGATAEEIAIAQASLTQAEQTLALKQKPYTEADIQAQRQAVAQAEALLATKQSPYTDADLQTAQASVDQAQAALDLAQYNLANASLVAPFDGVVSTVSVNVGELAANPAIVLVNPSGVRLDVNVDETDIGRVAVGQKATITFDAIPGRSFAGRTTAVAPSAQLQSGVATYVVSIGIAEPGPVRPGMTGNASIVYGEQENALIVPNRAVRTQGRTRVVEVLTDAGPELRQVRVGVSNDQSTAILEGVAEGEQVVIPTTTTFQPRVGPGAQPAPAVKTFSAPVKP